MHYVLEHSEAVGVLVEDDDQRAKVEGVGRRARPRRSPTSTRCANAGGRTPPSTRTRSSERADSIDEDDLFTFIYTSGTTGPPKACMIRHRNYYAMVQKGDEMEERLTEPGDVMLLYLPLAHNYGRLLHLSAAYIGFTIAFLPDPLRAADGAAARAPARSSRACRASTRRSTRPSSREFADQTGATPADRRLGAASRLPRLAAARRRSSPCRRASRSQHRLADRLVYSKVKERLGGRLRVANAGGAPLSREIAEFFHAIDILILEGYGLSEVTTAATVNRADGLPVRHGRQAAARRRARVSPTTARS